MADEHKSNAGLFKVATQKGMHADNDFAVDVSYKPGQKLAPEYTEVKGSHRPAPNACQLGCNNKHTPQ